MRSADDFPLLVSAVEYSDTVTRRVYIITERAFSL